MGVPGVYPPSPLYDNPLDTLIVVPTRYGHGGGTVRDQDYCEALDATYEDEDGLLPHQRTS